MSTITELVTLTKIDCCVCGMTFAVPSAWERARREKHDRFQCPNGHSLSFKGESESEKAHRLLAAERARHDQTRAEAEHERRSHAATKGHLTRTKNRVKNGVCPCCNRSFENLARHMETKHPGYGDD